VAAIRAVARGRAFNACPRHDLEIARTTFDWAFPANLEHFPEKWSPVFRQKMRPLKKTRALSGLLEPESALAFVIARDRDADLISKPLNIAHRIDPSSCGLGRDVAGEMKPSCRRKCAIGALHRMKVSVHGP
jgi:hypothetical protein